MKMIFLFLITISSFPSFADGDCDASCQQEAATRVEVNRRNGQNGNGNGGNAVSSACDRTISNASPSIVVTAGDLLYTSATQATPLPAAPGQSALSPDAANAVKICKGYETISNRLGSTLADVSHRSSQDGKITCQRKAGITADYDSCTSAVSMYDTIVVAEAAMQIFQGVQTNNVQNKVQNDVNTRAAQGDTQNAAYDAQVTTMNSAKALNEQQAAAYAAAVAALYSKIQSWIKEDQASFQRVGCGSAAPNTKDQKQTSDTPAQYATADAIGLPQPNSPDCTAAAEKAFGPYQGFIFANREAKGALTSAAMLFAGKAIAAGIKASQLGAIAKQVEAAKNATEDPYNPATFEYCQVNTTDPRCAGVGTRTAGSGLQDGGFGFGGDFGNNAFTQTPDDANGLAPVGTSPLAGNDRVADVGNPLRDDAKKASGILNPAAAASIQPGGSASGGSSGGSSSTPGGGSASLGNNVPGVDDSKKENDIKANKADGKYNLAGGGGFQAIKPMKDENPFANLFDGKGGGKLEEDRSIASNDGGADSGLFAKISKRYNQVQADKRIEAKNLDE